MLRSFMTFLLLVQELIVQEEEISFRKKIEVNP